MVCSEEEYLRVFKRMNQLPPEVEHLIVQLGDATSLVALSSGRTKCQHRNPDCVPSLGVPGERVVIEIQSPRHIREDGVFRFERVCE
jgi:hypothetical protein